MGKKIVNVCNEDLKFILNKLIKRYFMLYTKEYYFISLFLLPFFREYICL